MYSNNINVMFRGKYKLFSTSQEKENLEEVIYPKTIDNCLTIEANS